MELHTIPYRRSYERYILEAQATLVIHKNKEKPSMLRDLSARGASVITDYPLMINEKMTIAINVPFLFDRFVYKEAKIVWCKKIDENLWQCGLDFGEDNKITLF